MCKEIKDASKRSFLNEKLWDKLKYLDGRGELPIHDLVRISEYITDKRDGIFDDMSFNYYDTFKADFFMTKEEALDNYESSMNHAMVVTGVNLEDNKSTKWKLENSWGEDVGNKGYFVASDTWFEKYVYQVVINKKYLTQEQLDEMAYEPVELKPWDPMGTLA